MKKISLLIFGIVTIGTIIYFIVFILPFLFVSRGDATNNTRCKSEKRALKEGLSGVLVNKFRDMNSHMWETVEYSNARGKMQSLIFMNDRCGAFDFLLPGDSIKKTEGSLELTIIRQSEIRKFHLDFGCLKER